MNIHLLSGFLGSGKTTAIQHACSALLQQNISVGVITNDQGIKLVDGAFFESLGIPNRKVVNGCFCCNYNDLDAGIQSLIEANNPDVIFAESVGSCTDIVATVLKPLLSLRNDVQVTVSTFADVRLLRMMLDGNNNTFDETVRYIYHKQLEEAGVIVVNKTDLIDAEELEEIKQLMQEKYPTKTLLFLSAMDADGIQQWLHTLNATGAARHPSLQIDYDVYGAGEAKLAWLDEEIELYSAENRAMQCAADIMNRIYSKINLWKYSIGHLKFLLNDEIKISYTATTQPMMPADPAEASRAKLLINARVQTTPELLNELVDEAIEEVRAENGCEILVNSLSHFQPGYPRPTYRIAE